MKNHKRVFLYVRVSTQEQAKDGYSISEQSERLTDYCNALDWTVIETYSDAGFSGSNTNRPALRRMLDDIDAGKCDVVMVYKLDRLSRSQKDTLELIEDSFLANGIDFVSITENFDTSTPFGRAMIGLLSVFAQLEREQIRERITMGRVGRAKKGMYHGGGSDPVGYDYVDGQLIVNEYEAMQIKEIHDLYQSGHSFYGIASIFYDKGYSHKYGIWNPQRVKDVMLNDLYTGIVHFGKESYKGIHTPIIDEDTFEKSTALYESMDYSKCKNYGKNTYLGGLLFCKHCGAKYAVAMAVKTGKQYRYYKCYSRANAKKSLVRDKNCKNKIWRMDDLDNLVLDEIRKLATDPSHMINQSKSDESDKEAIIREEISKIDAQKSRLMDLYGLGEFTINEIQSKVSPLNERRDKLEKELATIKKTALSREDALTLITSFDDILTHGTHEEIRLLIRSLIDRIEIDNEDITIYWKFV